MIKNIAKYSTCCLVLIVSLFCGNAALAQQPATTAKPKMDLVYPLNEDGSHYVKFNFTNQVWVRYAEENQGSTLNGTRVPNVFDIGLRRTRMQLYGKPSDHIFFYLQMGQNNFNYLSARKTGFFIHDALMEVSWSKHFEMGAGLTAWTGFSRFSSPSVGGIMGLDAPLFLQATNDATDQFLRKFSTYAKGKIGKLDYRIILSKPMSFTSSSLYSSTTPIDTSAAKFSPLPPNVQWGGYLNYQFFDQESNQVPYMKGSYLGQKRVFNIGAGMQYQKDAMWIKQGPDTVKHNMLLAAVDFFYDAPLNKEKGNAISIYGVLTHYDLGKNYMRELGVMNNADGISSSTAISGSSGVALPLIGTGNSAYLQVGYLTKNLVSGKFNGRLMPYASAQLSQWERLNDKMLFVDAGCSLFLDDTRSKITLALQNRPEYDKTTFKQIQRHNALILQYQFSI
jgi:hypothetical protein